MSFQDLHSSQIDILFDILKDYHKDKFDLEVESIEDIQVKSRKQPLVSFRKLMMVILGETYLGESHKDKKHTQEEIAKVVGRDRTSFIHHSKKHLNDYSRYPDYKQEYDQLREKFDQKIAE